MRAATASARDPRGERTLMGIGPQFIRREVVADGFSGTLDGVPQERMDRTPSSPIVVEPQAVLPSPTVRIPVASPARTVQLSVAPTAVPTEPASSTGRPSPRLDSLVSARFFQEGEKQEANGWEDSPLVNEPFPDDEPPKFSSFDRVPRHRAPLLVTTFLLGTGLVIGLAMEGAGTGAARDWVATQAGPRVLQVWNRARTGLALRLTPESTDASARALAAAPAEPTAPAAIPTSAAPTAAAPAMPIAPAVAVAPGESPKAAPSSQGSSDSSSEEDLWAPLVAAPPAPRRSDKLVTSRPKPADIWHRAGEARPTVAARAEAPRGSGDETGREPSLIEQRSGTPVPAGVGEGAVLAAAPASAPKSAQTADRGEPRHGLVWSPGKQRLVPVESAFAEVPAAEVAPRPADADKGPAANAADKDVLPLDDEAHATY